MSFQYRTATDPTAKAHAMTTRFAAIFAVMLVAWATLSGSENRAAGQNAGERPPAARPDTQMKLWRQIDLGDLQGTFPCPGDLDNDGRVDFLLYRQGPQTTPGYLAAVDHDGRRLWEMGDASIEKHAPDGRYREPALRGIALVFDIDGDGKSEVVSEFWKDGVPMLYVLDGATGRVEHARPSPLDLKVRGGKRSRCHPVGRVAYLNGKDKAASVVLKYGASGHVPCHVVALDATLKTLWHLQTHGKTMAHVPTVGDVDGDGRDELLVGTLLVDDDGKQLWEKQARNHADCTAILDLPGGSEKGILISICNTGPAYCLSVGGETLWEKTTKEVSHGQGIWAGDFIGDEPGQEVIILRSGHVGDFITVRGRDGTQLAAFKQQREFKGYPDFPCPVDWCGGGQQSLWIPIDRRLVDGKGQIVAELGEHEPHVQEVLHWGTTKSHVATQVFAVDLCGDRREELVMYQPYNGRGILIFTQPDSEGEEKPYVHCRSVYNMHTYF